MTDGTMQLHILQKTRKHLTILLIVIFYANTSTHNMHKKIRYSISTYYINI